MDKEVLEVVLKKSPRDSNVARILEVTTESALPQGENFASVILKVMMKVVLGNGRVTKRSLIVKKALPGVASNAFSIEATVYTDFLKEMEYLMDEFDDHDGPLWCDLVHYDPKEPKLVMEDLKASGFNVVPRQTGMDMDHALLTLRNLGRYHAMVKILEERGLVSKEKYSPYDEMRMEDDALKAFFYGGFMCTVKGIRKYWGPEWTSLADRLSVPLERFIEKFRKFSHLEEGTFTCLNHGDCWSNNMMFKYDWQNRPVAVRFVDYQMPKHTTPCRDITNFIYMSIPRKLRQENYKILLQCYYESLNRTLDKYGYTGYKISFEDLEKIMERLKFFGLTLFSSFFGMVTCKSTNSFDIDVVWKSVGEEGFNVEVYSEPEMIHKLHADLTDFAELLNAA